MITIEAPAKHWLAALQRHVQVADRRSTIPILANVLLQPGDGLVTITSTDMDMTLSTRLPVDRIEGQACTVPADRLLAAIRAAPEQATATILPNGDDIQLGHDGGSFRLPTLPADEFPKLAEDEEEGGRVTLDAARLAACLKRVQPAMSMEETRFYLNGVSLQQMDELMLLTATDGHRLHHVPMECADVAGDLGEVVLPRPLVAQLCGMTGDLTLTIGARRAVAASGGTRLSSRVIDGTYPDWRRVVPQPENAKLRVGVAIADLLQAVERVSWVLDKEKARIMKVAIAKGELALSAAAESVSGTTEVAADVEGTPLTVGLNARYLTDLLRALPGDRATLRLTDLQAPILVTSDEHPDNRMVLMPARV